MSPTIAGGLRPAIDRGAYGGGRLFSTKPMLAISSCRRYCSAMRPLLLLLVFLATLQAADPPFRVPEGFKVTKYAGDILTHDTWSMTISLDGRVAVSGSGYIKVLLDTDKDGVADKTHLVTQDARNVHGLLWIGNDLLSVQPHGIFRHRDRDRDGLPESNPELFYNLPGGGGEHGPHGLRKGPDGWFYLACGNNTKIGKANITTKTSPIEEPSQGTILRISPDGKQSEVIAHGFRNHYDLAFNKHGHLFTFDSDGERDHQLPWYSFCRVFHVRVGGHHGWLLPGHQRSFNRPPYFFDSAPRLVEIDRGSPTGVEVYRHKQFPKKFQDGLFYACWTYGRVYFTPLLPGGEGYQPQEPEIFLETTGNLGFAPSDLAVHPPSGDLFVSVGGRGTQGSVYRVSYPAGSKAKAPPTFETPTDWNIHQQAIEKTMIFKPEDALLQLVATTDIRKRNLNVPEVTMNAIRSLMLHLGDISTSEAKRRIDAGYTANKPDALDADVRDKVITSFNLIMPSNLKEIDYEAARLLGMLKADNKQSIAKVATLLTPESHPTDDAHYLFCLAQMPGARGQDTRDRIVRAFLLIDQKLAQRKLLTDRNWSINLRDALKAHLEIDPLLGEQLARASAIASTPYHAYLLDALPREAQIAAAKAMLRAGTGWNAAAFGFVRKALPPTELLPIFRTQWSKVDLRPHLTGFFTKHGHDADKQLVEEFYRPPSSDIDLTPFNERIKKVDWSQGDATRGQVTYARFNCVTCHTGSNRLGPTLKNIAKRFNRDDLFRHINEPNLAVSDLYKATQITTREGTYVGIPVYKSEAQTILETGAGETIRFSRHDILSERRPNQSPMPPALLLAASREDLADLYAYLKTL